jgi:hypothetical protein
MIIPLIFKAMNELKNKYGDMKQQAVEMMQNGNVNAYLARLVTLNDMRIQMIQISAGNS